MNGPEWKLLKRHSHAASAEPHKKIAKSVASGLPFAPFHQRIPAWPRTFVSAPPEKHSVGWWFARTRIGEEPCNLEVEVVDGIVPAQSRIFFFRRNSLRGKEPIDGIYEQQVTNTRMVLGLEIILFRNLSHNFMALYPRVLWTGVSPTCGLQQSFNARPAKPASLRMQNYPVSGPSADNAKRCGKGDREMPSLKLSTRPRGVR